MRNGNLYGLFLNCSSQYVFTLPMRNGNEKLKRGLELSSCIYPTYEEWKHEIYHVKSKKDVEVFTLPMRNGNVSLMIFSINECLLCIYPTYEEWKLDNYIIRCINSSVFTLPMRNGNWVWVKYLKQ